MQQWHKAHLVVRGADFSVTVDGQPPQTFPNPIVNPTPSLYLGDGIEADYISSLSGSEFLMDLGTLHRRVKQP